MPSEADIVPAHEDCSGMRGSLVDFLEVITLCKTLAGSTSRSERVTGRLDRAVFCRPLETHTHTPSCCSAHQQVCVPGWNDVSALDDMVELSV